MKAAFTKIYAAWERLDFCESGPATSPICAEITRSMDLMPFRSDDTRAYIAQEHTRQKPAAGFCLVCLVITLVGAKKRIVSV